jgi:hypothetical protein
MVCFINVACTNSKKTAIMRIITTTMISMMRDQQNQLAAITHTLAVLQAVIAAVKAIAKAITPVAITTVSSNSRVYHEHYQS